MSATLEMTPKQKNSTTEVKAVEFARNPDTTIGSEGYLADLDRLDLYSDDVRDNEQSRRRDVLGKVKGDSRIAEIADSLGYFAEKGMLDAEDKIGHKIKSKIDSRKGRGPESGEKFGSKEFHKSRTEQKIAGQAADLLLGLQETHGLEAKEDPYGEHKTDELILTLKDDSGLEHQLVVVADKDDLVIGYKREKLNTDRSNPEELFLTEETIFTFSASHDGSFDAKVSRDKASGESDEADQKDLDTATGALDVFLGSRAGDVKVKHTSHIESIDVSAMADTLEGRVEQAVDKVIEKVFKDDETLAQEKSARVQDKRDEVRKIFEGTEPVE